MFIVRRSNGGISPKEHGRSVMPRPWFKKETKKERKKERKKASEELQWSAELT